MQVPEATLLHTHANMPCFVLTVEAACKQTWSFKSVCGLLRLRTLAFTMHIKNAGTPVMLGMCRR